VRFSGAGLRAPGLRFLHLNAATTAIGCFALSNHGIGLHMVPRSAPRRVAPSRAAAVRRALAGHPAAKRSLRILLIALGLLFAQVPSVLHLLLVPHTTCEHGELVEVVEHRPGARGAPEAAPRPDSTSGRPQIAVSRGHDGGHDHCDALAVRHQIPDVGVAVRAASLLSIEPTAERGERGETRPVALLALAPKSSPPAA